MSARIASGGIYHKSQPTSHAQFRDNTDRAGKMLGVTSTPKRCRCVRCGKMRTEATGEHAKAGFICHRCGNA